MADPAEGEADPLKPWASDDRLKDPFLMASMSEVVNIVEEFAALAEQLPKGRHMPKTESILKMWAAVLDLHFWITMINFERRKNKNDF
jgi:hypothetical protein